MSATMTTVRAPEKFRVIESLHYEPKKDWEGHRLDPARLQVFKKGEVIESQRDLESQFPNKFKKLSDEESAPPIDKAARKLAVNLLIEAGNWKEEDRRFLENLSEENYKRMNERFASVTAFKSPEDKASSILGADCTSEFQRAYDEGYKVFQNAKGKYNVTTKMELNKPINSSPLEKDKVDDFVGKWIKEK